MYCVSAGVRVYIFKTQDTHTQLLIYVRKGNDLLFPCLVNLVCECTGNALGCLIQHPDHIPLCLFPTVLLVCLCFGLRCILEDIDILSERHRHFVTRGLAQTHTANSSTDNTCTKTCVLSRWMMSPIVPVENVCFNVRHCRSVCLFVMSC